MRLPLDSLFQFLSGAGAGALLYLISVARPYWRGLRWLLGGWGTNFGHETEEDLISYANRTALLIGAVLVMLAIAGPSTYQRNWEIVMLGMALGMLIAHLLLVTTASSRAAAKRR